MVSAVRFLAGALMIAGGCSGTSDEFFIVQNQVPEANCTIPATKGNLYRGSGVMDVGLVSEHAEIGYRLFPLLQNDLPAAGKAGATEPNRLALSEFRVHVLPGRGAPAELVNLLASPALAPYITFSEPWSGSVDPSGGNTAASVTAVPAEVARQIAASGMLASYTDVPLLVRVTAVGSTLSETIESRAFEFPIKACQYCLVSAVGACPATPANTGNACNVAQDDPVDCCSVGDGSLSCPSRAPEGTN
jgi:hypothetical protein